MVKRRDVVNQFCELSSGRPEHAVMHFCRRTLHGGKQLLKGSGLPHKRPARVFTRPEDVVLVAKANKTTGNAV